jgi:hypothetical protein
MLVSSTHLIYSQAIDESALFSDSSSTVDSAKVINTVASKQVVEKAVGFSGEITSAHILGLKRSFYSDATKENTTLANYVVGDLMLDVRLPQGAKAFANLEAQYMPQLPMGSNMIVGLQEIFVDANIDKKVYVRLGKQVLQWGRCWFFNPVDLINVEKKLFIQRIGYREGAYGLKLHVPFGTKANIYGFIDTKNASSVDSVAAAGKVEFLLGGTEMAFSLWDKPTYHPVVGYDISTRLLGLDIAGEVAVSHGSNTPAMRETNGVLDLYKSEDWITKVAIDIGRNFDFFGFADAITLMASFYYNQAGYNDNAFSDSRNYQYASPVMMQGKSGIPLAVTDSTKQYFLESNNLYEMNSYSKYYAALFFNVNRVFFSGLTYTFNYMANCQQGSSILSTGVGYTSLSEFTINALVIANMGADKLEYTYGGNGLTFRVTAGVTF